MQDVISFSVGSFFVPAIVSRNVLLLSPLSKAVHEFAFAHLTEAGARRAECLQYFAKPIDRVIQGMGNLVISSLELTFVMITILRTRGALWRKIVAGILSPLFVAVYIMIVVVDTLLLFTNGALQLLLPYQTIYSVVMGKKAIKKYFDNREGLLQSTMVNLSFLKEPNDIPKPKWNVKKIVEYYKMEGKPFEDSSNFFNIRFFNTGRFWLIGRSLLLQ